MNRQCSSCGGFCKKSGCERENVKSVVNQSLTTQPVAWLTEERYAAIHTSKWSPKIQQVFSKDGILESQTIQYTPQSKPVTYPSPQSTWVSLTDEKINQFIDHYWADDNVLMRDLIRMVEAEVRELQCLKTY